MSSEVAALEAEVKEFKLQVCLLEAYALISVMSLTRLVVA